MHKVIAIHQPDYIPWLGFYYKVAHSDQFVYLDDVQFSNEAAHNFNVIKTPQGEFRLKIPVEYKFGDPINTIHTKDELKWREKHLKTIEMNYKKAAHFDEIYPRFKEVMMAGYDNLAELNIALNQFILEGFNICVPYVRTSELNVLNVREERILEICKRLNATEYLSGNGAKAYQVQEHFINAGLSLTYLDYKPVEYVQVWPKTGFLSCLSAIDYILNCGFDWNYVEKEVKELNRSLRR